jgi:hypothetical protein
MAKTGDAAAAAPAPPSPYLPLHSNKRQLHCERVEWVSRLHISRYHSCEQPGCDILLLL